MEHTQKEAQENADKHFNFLSGFCHDYCEDEAYRKEFFDNLKSYVDWEIELEKFCNQ